MRVLVLTSCMQLFVLSLSPRPEVCVVHVCVVCVVCVCVCVPTPFPRRFQNQHATNNNGVTISNVPTCW